MTQGVEPPPVHAKPVMYMDDRPLQKALGGAAGSVPKHLRAQS